YLKRDDWKQAQYYFSNTLDTARKYHLRESEYEALIALADLQQLQGFPERTLTYLAEADALNINTSTYRKNVARMLSGVAWYQLKNYRKAEHYLLQALHSAQQDHSPEHLIKSREWLARLYATTGRPILAYAHLD